MITVASDQRRVAEPLAKPVCGVWAQSATVCIVSRPVCVGRMFGFREQSTGENCARAFGVTRCGNLMYLIVCQIARPQSFSVSMWA